MKKLILFIAFNILLLNLNAQIKEITRYHSNKKISETGNILKNGTNYKTGAWKYYHKNGQLKAYGKYTKNSKSGEWKYYYENGVLEEITNYEVLTGNSDIQKRLGEYKSYFKNSQLEHIGNYDGMKIGEWKSYYENGQPLSKGRYEKASYRDVRIGEWEFYHENGQLSRTRNYTDITWKVYTENGQILENLTMVSERIRNKELFYENGIRKGVGNIKIWDNGLKREGQWELYYKSGELHEVGNYKWGQKIGEWKYYHKNGNVYQNRLMDHDKLMDIIRCVDDQGNRLNKGTLVNGNGTVNNYNKDGKLIDTDTYKGGKKQ